MSYKYTQHVFLAFFWLAMANSAVNPIIYFLMNAKCVSRGGMLEVRTVVIIVPGSGSTSAPCSSRWSTSGPGAPATTPPPTTRPSTGHTSPITHT